MARAKARLSPATASLLSRPAAVAAAWLVAAVGALAACLPAVWWEPLHVDEQVTLTRAPQSVGAILEQIFVEKGGAPVYFLVERVTLAWPGGVEGLRLPSVVFFLLALPAAGLVARRVGGRTAGGVVPAVVGLAPLAVELATFGRMYALFVALVLWTTWAALRVGESGRHRDWLVLGALAGALVYVHPIAPLYGGLVLATAALLARARLRTLAALAGAAAVAFFVVGAPYYLHALPRLRERYYVGYAGSARLETTAGRSVPEEALFAFTPGGMPIALLFAAFALAGLVALTLTDRRAAAALALWVAVPVGFFSLVPAGDVAAGGTRFFDRYLVAALPAFLLLVVVGALGLGRLLRRPIAAGAAVSAVLALEGADAAERLAQLRALALPELAAAVSPYAERAVVFDGLGTAGAGAGRSPRLLDDYLALESPTVERGLGDQALVAERAPTAGRFGLWVVRASHARMTATVKALRRVPGLVPTRVSAQLLLIRTRQPVQSYRLARLDRRIGSLFPSRGRRAQAQAGVLAIDRGGLFAFDPDSLAAPPARRARLGGHTHAWSRSTDGSRIVFGSEGPAELRFVDVRQMRVVADDLRLQAKGAVLFTAWPAADRVFAIVQTPGCCIGEAAIFLVDAERRQVLRRRGLGGSLQAAVATQAGLAILLGPSGSVGGSRLLIADRYGRLRAAALSRIRSGQSHTADRRIAATVEQPALAIDTGNDRAFVIGARGPLAEVDLSSLRVAYHELGQAASLLGRLRGWLEPEARADAPPSGSVRRGEWLGNGRLAVSGSDWRYINGRLREVPAGLAVIDTRRMSRRVVDDRPSDAIVRDDTLLAFVPASVYGAEPAGMLGYDLDGKRRFHLFPGKEAAPVLIRDRRAYVVIGRFSWPKVAVVDLATGRTLDRLRLPRANVIEPVAAAERWPHG
jgi:hypothetical protein